MFTVIDATSGYWHAQDVFQKEIDLTYEGLPGVAAIVDDIFAYGKNLKDHDAKLEVAEPGKEESN